MPIAARAGPRRPISLERVIDKMCRELGLDPFEVRRKNLLTPDQFPYTTPVGLVYDTGNYQATLDKAMAMADVAGFGKRAAESKARGKLRGMGLSTWIEACGIAPSHLVGILGSRVGLYDAATVRVNATGKSERDGRRAQPRAGPRDGVRADRGGQAGRAGSSRRDRAWRHLEDPVRDGVLRVAVAGGLRGGDDQGGGQDRRQGQEDRRAYAGGVRGRHHLRGRQVQRGGDRQGQDLRRDRLLGLCPAQLPLGDAGTGAGGDGISTTRPTSPIPQAPISARSRWTRAPARSMWWPSTVPTTSATS
jgi:hypothetical protein